MSVHNVKLTPAGFIEDEAADYQIALGGRRCLRHRRKKLNEHMLLDQLQAHASPEAAPAHLGTEAVFNPTFLSSKHEREWILSYLGAFYDDKQITDVLSRVKGGKEANVYCCAAHPATGPRPDRGQNLSPAPVSAAAQRLALSPGPQLPGRPRQGGAR